MLADANWPYDELELLTKRLAMANLLGMDLISYLDEFGNRALAQALGVTPSLISQWKTGRRNVSPESAIRIERATNSAVTRAELRPDIFVPLDETRDRGAA